MRFLCFLLSTAAIGVVAASTASAQAPTDPRREDVPRELITMPTCLDQRGLAPRLERSATKESVLTHGSCDAGKVFVDENPGDVSDSFIGDPDGRWWIRMNLDDTGRPERIWGRNAEGRYWIQTLGDGPAETGGSRPAEDLR